PRVDAAGLERDPSADQALARDARAAELDPGNAHAFALVHEESNLRARSVLGGDELARDLGEREAVFGVRIEQPTPRAIDLELGNRLTGHEASRRDEARERLFVRAFDHDAFDHRARAEPDRNAEHDLGLAAPALREIRGAGELGWRG